MPEVAPGWADHGRGLSIGLEELFLFVERPGSRWRVRLADLRPAGFGSLGPVTIDNSEELRTSRNAAALRGFLKRAYPEAWETVLERVIGALMENIDVWPEAEATSSTKTVGELVADAMEKLVTLRLHPLIDYHPEIGLTMGALLEGSQNNLIITKDWAAASDNKGLLLREAFPERPQVKRPSGCALRAEHMRETLLVASTLIDGKDLAVKPEKEVLLEVLRKGGGYWYHSDQRWHLAVTCWIIGTYMFPVFDVYPPLHLQGERESGKTTLLMLLSRLAWNPTPLEAALREANLFRTIEGSRPTYLIDVTRLSGRDPRMRDVIDVFEAGYTRGGAVSRCDPETLEPIKYELYSPKAIATRVELPFEAKCIRIISVKATDPAFTERQIYILRDPEMAVLVGVLIRSALLNAVRVRVEYEALRQTDKLRGRRFQLWQTLLAVCKVYAPDRFEELLSLAEWDALQAEPGDLQSEVEEALLSILIFIVEEKRTWPLKELTAMVTDRVPWVKSYHPVKDAIVNLSISKERRQARGGVTYRFDLDQVRAKAEARGITKAEAEVEEPADDDAGGAGQTKLPAREVPPAPTTLQEGLKAAEAIGIRLVRENDGNPIKEANYCSALVRELGLKGGEINRILKILLQEDRAFRPRPGYLGFVGRAVDVEPSPTGGTPGSPGAEEAGVEAGSIEELVARSGELLTDEVRRVMPGCCGSIKRVEGDWFRRSTLEWSLGVHASDEPEAVVRLFCGEWWRQRSDWWLEEHPTDPDLIRVVTRT